MYERFAQLLQENGVTAYRVSKETGIATATLSDWKKGRSVPKQDKMAKIADYFHVSVDYLLGRTDDPIDYEDGDFLAELNQDILDYSNGYPRKAYAIQKAIDQDALKEISEQRSFYKTGVKIPVLGKVAAGVPIEAIEDVLDYEEITNEMASNGDYFALKINGQSMEPKFSEGDVVIVRKQEDIECGDIAIVLVNGQDATCKKVLKYDNGISLISTNPAFSPMYYNAEQVEKIPIRIIGKVVELRAKF